MTPTAAPPEERHSRQVLFAPIGRGGQARLAQSRVLVVGCGALGSGILEMTARAGVGLIRFVDRDFVEVSNLQRQSLYTEKDAAERLPKAVAAHRALALVDGALHYDSHVKDFNHTNAMELAQGIDLILDGADNLETRALLNETAVKLGIPWVYGGCVASGGVVMAVVPGKTPCLRCILPAGADGSELPTCDTLGIISPAARIVSAMETALALRLLVGGGEAFSPYMLHFDCWTGDFYRMDLSGARQPECPVCGRREFPRLAGEGASRAVALCGRNMVQVDFPGDEPGARRPDLDDLARRLAPLGEVVRSDFLLTFSIPPHQLILFPDGRCLVKGVSSPEEAKSLYARYFGL